MSALINPVSPATNEPRLNIYSAITANRWRTALLICMFTVLIAALGFAFGELYSADAGLIAIPVALLVAALMSLGAYYGGDQLVLGISGAHEVSEAEEPELHHIVEALAVGAGLPTPRIYVINDPSPNAFATGRDPRHSSIAVTAGLLQKLDRTELEGVIAHELSHVRNRDTRVLLIAAVLLGMAALISDLMIRGMFWGGGRRSSRDRDPAGVVMLVIAILLAILAPILAQLIRLAVSRQREYLADASGALLTRYPEGLASALRKISDDREPLKTANRATSPLYIVNPLHVASRRLDNLFDTHPPIADRIRRLEAM
jgi:heat shock protein HtpX